LCAVVAQCSRFLNVDPSNKKSSRLGCQRRTLRFVDQFQSARQNRLKTTTIDSSTALAGAGQTRHAFSRKKSGKQFRFCKSISRSESNLTAVTSTATLRSAVTGAKEPSSNLLGANQPAAEHAAVQWRLPSHDSSINAHNSLDWRAKAPPPSPPKHERCWCFFDVETTGPSLRDHFLCALGIAIVALGDANSEPVLLTSQKWFIRPPDAHRQWDRKTLGEFWLQPQTRPLYDRICR